MKRRAFQFRTQDEVTAYWEERGPHRMSEEEVREMVRLMVDDVTFRITTEFLCQHLGLVENRDHLLDAGCGWGRSLLGVKRRYPALRVTGVDITPGLLELGRQIAEQLGVSGVDWRVGDILSLPFEDETFSHVISARVLQYIVEPPKAVRELVRVLRPGGRMILVVPNKLNPFYALFYHTKVHSPGEMRRWLPTDRMRVLRAASFGFVPPLRFLRKRTYLSRWDALLRAAPLLNRFGGLAYVVAEKRA